MLCLLAKNTCFIVRPLLIGNIMFKQETVDHNRNAVVQAIKKDNVRFALKCVAGVAIWTVGIRLLAAANNETHED